MGKTRTLLRLAAASAASAVLFILTFPASAPAMKSDPDNYYLDPEEIRVYIEDNITGIVMLQKRVGGRKGWCRNVDENDVRLLDGQIPLYGIDGDIVAYIYLAYFGAGPAPTIAEVINKAREVSDDRDEAIRNRESSGVSLYEFDMEYFPYGHLCAYELVGATEKCTTGLGALALPRFILSQKRAEEAARAYYGSNDFEFVKYIFAATLHGYEFTNGSKTIIVPLDSLSGIVYADEIVTSEEVDANKEEYRYKFDAERAFKWVEMWKRLLAEHGIE